MRWSVVAVAVLIVWQYLIVLAAACEFNITPVPFAEAHRLAVRTFRWEDLAYASLGPGHDRLWLDMLTAGPLAALITWSIVCMRACSPDGRFFASLFMVTWPCFWGAWGIPLLVGSEGAWKVLFHGAGTATNFQAAARYGGAALWTVLSVPVMLMATDEAVRATRAARAMRAARRSQISNTCVACGYPLAGLPGPVCPECGANQSPAPAKE